jgi:hypothetical protein
MRSITPGQAWDDSRGCSDNSRPVPRFPRGETEKCVSRRSWVDRLLNVMIDRLRAAMDELVARSPVWSAICRFREWCWI